MNVQGYVRVNWVLTGRPNGAGPRYVLEHVAIAEKALGKLLPPGALVHHVDGDKTNNTPGNLVICQGTSYHFILHSRQRVLALGGDPNRDKICSHCKGLKSKTEFHKNRVAWDGLQNACADCMEIIRKQREFRKEQRNHGL